MLPFSIFALAALASTTSIVPTSTLSHANSAMPNALGRYISRLRGSQVSSVTHTRQLAPFRCALLAKRGFDSLGASFVKLAVMITLTRSAIPTQTRTTLIEVNVLADQRMALQAVRLSLIPKSQIVCRKIIVMNSRRDSKKVLWVDTKAPNTTNLGPMVNLVAVWDRSDEQPVRCAMCCGSSWKAQHAASGYGTIRTLGTGEVEPTAVVGILDTRQQSVSQRTAKIGTRHRFNITHTYHS